MKCKVTKMVRVNRKDLPPYIDIWAIGIRSDKDLVVTNKDYCASDPKVLKHLPPRFNKRLFPPTIAQADELQKACKTDRFGNVVGKPIFVRLMCYEWVTPPYYKVDSESITGVEETMEILDEVEEKKLLGTCIRTTVSYEPIVFSSLKMTLLETTDGKCAENGGDADGLCKRYFYRAIDSGRFLLQENAQQIKKIIRDEEEWIYEDENKHDIWGDYYNWGYYNDGLDTDQQDERFWDF